MKKFNLIKLIVVVCSICLISLFYDEAYSITPSTSSSVNEADSQPLLIAKAKKKKSKKKGKKSKKKKKSKKSKSSKLDNMTFGDQSYETISGEPQKQNLHSYIGVGGGGGMTKKSAIIIAEAKMSIRSIFPYVNFKYFLASKQYFSFMHIGGGLMYSFGITPRLQVLAGLGASAGLLSIVDKSYEKYEVFAKEQEEPVDKASFVYVDIKAQGVFHIIKYVSVFADLGMAIQVSEGAKLSAEAKPIVDTGFVVGGGLMFTF